MSAEELRSKSVDELKQERLALVREQFGLRMKRAAGDMLQTHKFKQTRREIARINTILTEKGNKA